MSWTKPGWRHRSRTPSRAASCCSVCDTPLPARSSKGGGSTVQVKVRASTIAAQDREKHRGQHDVDQGERVCAGVCRCRAVQGAACDGMLGTTDHSAVLTQHSPTACSNGTLRNHRPPPLTCHLRTFGPTLAHDPAMQLPHVRSHPSTHPPPGAVAPPV